MNKCDLKTQDGNCTKWRYEKGCKPSNIDWCDEPVEMIDSDEMCKYSSIFGNTYSFITSDQLKELENGKAIYINDGEYCHFVMLKGENNG